MEKIKVLVIVTSGGGVCFFRQIQPHIKLGQMYPDEFEIVVKSEDEIDFNNLGYFDEFNIVQFHKGMTDNVQRFIELSKYFKEQNIVLIVDVDDYWDLDQAHPMFIGELRAKTGEKTKECIKQADYVTTTTDIFKKLILPFNKSVEVLPNAIDSTDPNFIVEKKPCCKLRVGMVMGSSHKQDIDTVYDFVSLLPKEILDQIVIVLCGFDLRGVTRVMDANGNIESVRQIEPKDSIWSYYEKIVTNNYKIISPQYKSFLEQFIPDSKYNNEIAEGYIRRWTKDMEHYYQHYSEVDVLIAPLKSTKFNSAKSQLKAIEAAFSHTALIATNYGPYTIDLNNIFKKGGDIDTTGNAILLEERKGGKDLAKAITKIVKNRDLVTLLQDNLYNDLHEKYDLRTVTEKRANFYRKINKK